MERCLEERLEPNLFLVLGGQCEETRMQVKKKDDFAEASVFSFLYNQIQVFDGIKERIAATATVTLTSIMLTLLLYRKIWRESINDDLPLEVKAQLSSVLKRLREPVLEDLLAVLQRGGQYSGGCCPVPAGRLGTHTTIYVHSGTV